MFKKLIALALIPLFFMTTGCVKDPTPQDIFGTYTAPLSADSQFEANVSEGSIEVNLVSADTKALYWKGTFNLPSATSSEFAVNSEADTDALSQSILGSQDPTKAFKYSGGKIDFDFGAMGVTKTITLTKR